MHWLVAQQNADGGFSFGTAGAASDVDDTGAVLEALGPVGPAGAVRRAAAFLRAAQNGDGGLPSQPGGPSNAQSTAWAVQGLLAAGVDPAAVHHGAGSPLAYLSSLIAPDGHVRYAAGVDQTPVWVTGEAMMALARAPLPLAPVPAPAPSVPLGSGPPTRGAATPSSASTHRNPGQRATNPAAPGTRAARHRDIASASPAAGLGEVLAADESGLVAELMRVLTPLAGTSGY